MTGKPWIVIAGPTATGKSRLAVEIATAMDGEIIGADAFQIYQGLSLLTAQPAADILDAVPHHLIGSLDPDDACSAARYSELAREAMKKIRRRNRMPVVAGGTGLYIKALTHGLDTSPPANEALRTELTAMDLPALVERLRNIDPEALSLVDVKNPQRVIRAIELIETTQRPLREFRNSWRQPCPDVIGFWLEPDRDELRTAIERRTRQMFEAGVVEEVRTARHLAPLAPGRAIGFEVIGQFLDGKISEPDCRRQVEIATRRYAKRQMTWFRNQSGLTPWPISLPPESGPLIDAIGDQLAALRL